jgi:hypothetical protein
MFTRTKWRKVAEAAHQAAHWESAKHLRQAVKDSKETGPAHVGTRLPVERGLNWLASGK